MDDWSSAISDYNMDRLGEDASSPRERERSNSQKLESLRTEYERAIEAARERERELKDRADVFQNTMRTLTEALSGLNFSNPSTSTPARLNSREGPIPFKNHIATYNPPIDPTFTNAYSVYPKSYIRDALELVPKYDGHNIPVWQFARACKRAKDSLPLVDEVLFVRMLRNKLSHHAYLAVEDETHLTVAKFLETLKRTFGSGRSANYYRGQLSIAYKKPGEHILDYIGRIKDLKTAIIEGDRINLDRELNSTEIQSIDSYALEAFYEGLPRDYRTELKAEGYTNFADACSKAITIHKRIEREEFRYRNTRNLRDESTSNNTQAPIRILQRNAPNSSPTNQATASNAFDGTRKICTYCKNFGHLFHECRKRQYRPNNPSFDNVNNNNNTNNNNVNTNNNAVPAIQKPGNQFEASASGTARGQGNVRPVFPLECTPEEYIPSNQTAATYPSSSFSLLPSEPP